jgi:hypothetical protein
LFAGKASLIPRHLPIDTLEVLAKQCIFWRQGTKFEVGFSEIQKEFRSIQRKFRRILANH